MQVPVNWLEEYVSGGENKEDVSERMSLSGTNVEFEKMIGDGSVTGVVLGKLTEVWPLEDSDHLLICMANVGSDDEIRIVTGAPNVNKGDFVPVALHGAVLPGGQKIKKGKIRGEVSEGMLCSAQELGFDDKVVPFACKDGIWILPEEARDEGLLGRDIFEVLGLSFTRVLEFEITPNRPDCLSVYGLAAEYAAVYDLALGPIETAYSDAHDAGRAPGSNAQDYIKVSITKPELCSRYVARVAEDVQIQESPWWIQKKLMLSGMRPINNIVDITNYVMLEVGNPIHAFDIREITGGEIHVDTAMDGEMFTTLDGVERALAGDTLMIKDGTRSVAIAGIMGGLNSEIREDTKTILIEAASFSKSSVRITSKKLGIRTEASSRFEKGIPAELSRKAADRVCELIMLTNAGKTIPGAVDCYPVPQEEVFIPVRTVRVNNVLGTCLTTGEIEMILKRLGISSEQSEEGKLVVTQPFNRVDLVEEIDIIEEIARIYGYDKLEKTMHPDSIEASVSKSWALRDVLRDTLTGLGLSEIQTYSFVSPSGIAMIGAEKDAGKNSFVKLLNPLGEENSVMRTTLLPELISALARNFNHSAKACSLFEIGNTFKNIINEEGLPTEAFSLCAGAYGEGFDFYFLKGCILRVFKKFGISEPVFEPVTDIDTFHPGRCAIIKDPESVVYGVIGELHPEVTDRFGIAEKVCAAEVDYDLLISLADMNRIYTPLPKYPAVLRDIALIVNDTTPVGTLLEIIHRKGGRILEKAELFDVYRGKQVPEGKKSLAFGLTFRDIGKTLTDEDAAKVLSKVLKGLEQDAGAVLRDV
jgi:phenylalanyl-tRNA synthetase beta chain